MPSSDWLGSNQIKYVHKNLVSVSGPVYHVYPTRYDMFLVFWLWCIEVVLQAAARGWLGWWRHTKVGAGPVPLSCLTSRSQHRDQALWRRNLEMMGKVARCPGSSTASGGTTTTTTYTLQLLHWYLSHYFSFPLNYSIQRIQCFFTSCLHLHYALWRWFVIGDGSFVKCQVNTTCSSSRSF